MLLALNRLEVVSRGLDRLPAGPCVIVANHVSFVDILVLLAVLPGTVRFLAKKGLFAVPLFGWALKVAGHIPVHRQDREAALTAYGEAAGMIRGGTTAIVFGEGTRSRDGRLKPLKKGPFVLAIRAGVPVVPACLLGTFEVLPKGSVAPNPHPIMLRVGATHPDGRPHV